MLIIFLSGITSSKKEGLDFFPTKKELIYYHKIK